MALSSCGWKLGSVQSSPGPLPPTKMYIYTWANYTDDELIKSFSEQTGIEVIADVFGSNEEMLAKIQAGGSSAYSIIYPSEYMVRKMIELDMLAELDHSRLSIINQLFEQFQNPDYDPGNRHSVPVSWGTTGLIYNTEKLKQPPEDWSYLWEYQKVLSRRMTLLEDVREVMGAVLRMLGYSYNSTDPKQIQQAYEKLKALKPAIASFTTDAWRPQILTGDLLVAMCYSSDATEVIEEDDNLQYVLPKSGSSLWTDTLVIPKFAPNPQGAYAWINFVLQPSVSAGLCERLSFATPSRAAFDILPEEIRTNTSLFPPESALKNCESVAPVGNATELYENLWTQLSST
jgi:spermidine/putrescine transport system substrate-binding protein